MQRIINKVLLTKYPLESNVANKISMMLHLNKCKFVSVQVLTMFSDLPMGSFFIKLFKDFII